MKVERKMLDLFIVAGQQLNLPTNVSKRVLLQKAKTAETADCSLNAKPEKMLSWIMYLTSIGAYGPVLS